MKTTKFELEKMIRNEFSALLKEGDRPRPQQGPGFKGGLPGVTRMAKKLTPLKKTSRKEELTKENISIWYNGNWHETTLTRKEHEAIHDAWDPEYERYSDVIERVLSNMRNLDIEDVELGPQTMNEIKITKQQLKQLIKEEIAKLHEMEASTYEHGAEAYRERIEIFKQMSDAASEAPGELQTALVQGIQWSLEDILNNIEDENTRQEVERMVSDLMHPGYLPTRV